jgi:hypothetical protein
MIRLRAPSIRRMFDGMQNNIGPIALGVTFVAGLAWLLLGCGGGPENPGWGTQTDPIAASAVDDAGAGAVWAVSPCSLLPSDTYCPGSASVWGPPDAAVLVPYWCSAGFSPGPSCAFVDGSGADGGAGQWCCQ